MVRASQLHHVGIPVSNLERSLAFYKDVFGVDPEFVADGSGDELSSALGVSDAVLSFAFLGVGPTILELLEYENPRGKAYDRGNCDVGATHVAFQVSDIRAAYEELVVRGISFNSPPLQIDGGPLAGCSFVYFTDPDGVQLELFEEPTV
jgi:catechol 2,3-dioxygenase-like lactoylglutathione lyase family enzyme